MTHTEVITAHAPDSMGASASVAARQRAEQAIWERMSALDVACDALYARSATTAWAGLEERV